MHLVQIIKQDYKSPSPLKSIYLVQEIFFPLSTLHPYLYPHPFFFCCLYLTPLNTHALALHIYHSLFQSPSLPISLFFPLFTFHLYIYIPLLSLSPINISLCSFCPLSLSLHLPYHSLSLSLETNIYTEINAFTQINQIGLEIAIYTKINAFSANNQIGLEIIYIETNSSSASNQI